MNEIDSAMSTSSIGAKKMYNGKNNTEQYMHRCPVFIDVFSA